MVNAIDGNFSGSKSASGSLLLLLFSPPTESPNNKGGGEKWKRRRRAAPAIERRATETEFLIYLPPPPLDGDGSGSETRSVGRFWPSHSSSSATLSNLTYTKEGEETKGCREGELCFWRRTWYCRLRCIAIEFSLWQPRCWHAVVHLYCTAWFLLLASTFFLKEKTFAFLEEIVEAAFTSERAGGRHLSFPNPATKRVVGPSHRHFSLLFFPSPPLRFPLS